MHTIEPIRRYPAPAFINSTPRIKGVSQSLLLSAPDMLVPANTAIGAGPLYTNALMGQAPSAAERDTARKASSTILRQDCICIEESENVSRPDSISLNYDRTDQAPYSTGPPDALNTKDSLLYVPKDNPSHDLVHFLQTTGPTAPHRRPSKLQTPQQTTSGPKNALRFLRIRPRRQRTISIPYDEGGLLSEKPVSPPRILPANVKQKVSVDGTVALPTFLRPAVADTLSGTKYLALDIGGSPDILESRVSVSVVDIPGQSETLDNWHSHSKHNPRRRVPAPAVRPDDQPPTDDEDSHSVNHDSSPCPVRPAASNPPTPEPQSAVSAVDSNPGCLTERSRRQSFDPKRALSSHPIQANTSMNLPLPKVSAIVQATPEKYIEIQHPSPRRLPSHPVLLQRASSIASSVYPRSVSDSPRPPPRSPLRLRRDLKVIDGTAASHPVRELTPKLAPSVKTASEYQTEIATIRPTVVTKCTGPITRPRSRDNKSSNRHTHPALRYEHEERIRTRKLRDQPLTTRTIDAVVNTPPSARRQRLKKARPQIQVPDLRPAPLATRASSSAWSSTSWKKVTEFTRTPVSIVPSEDTPSTGENTERTPISPAASHGSVSETMTISPVMLVAEEVPLPKSKSTPKPNKFVVKDGKPYAPRPRSASIPRHQSQKRSRQSARSSTRLSSPTRDSQAEDAPPLPSPPPTRALPPTPPTSEPERLSKPQFPLGTDTTKQLPITPLREDSPTLTTPKSNERLAHVVTQAQRKTSPPKDLSPTSNITVRLEALEKRNALLDAALTAVLRTNGMLNGPAPGNLERFRVPMVWEARIARRSAASHGASSSSSGRSLETYMSTYTRPSVRRGR